MCSLDYFQQSIVIKFFQKWKKSWKQTLDALCVVYGDNGMIKSLFYEWYKQFVDGRDDCANVPCSGWPVSMCNVNSIEKVKLARCKDRRQSLKNFADVAGINWETICLIVTEDVGMTKVSAKVVPKNLTSD